MKKLKKKLISAILSVALLTSMSVPAFAWNYSFTSSHNPQNMFDSPTQTDAFISENPNENVRRDKNTAHTPPPYGIFSGYIPTDVVNPHHRQDSTSTVSPTAASTHADFPSSAPPSGGGSPVAPPPIDDRMLPSTSLNNSGGGTVITEPSFFADGTMGTLEIPRFNRSLPVRSGATDANLMIGAAHLSSTSAWDGNVVISAHNRGVTHNFDFLTNMRVGDTVIYTTPHGTRTYELVELRQILVTDTSILAWSSDNILKLLTCVRYAPELRLVAKFSLVG